MSLKLSSLAIIINGSSIEGRWLNPQKTGIGHGKDQQVAWDTGRRRLEFGSFIRWNTTEPGLQLHFDAPSDKRTNKRMRAHSFHLIKNVIRCVFLFTLNGGALFPLSLKMATKVYFIFERIQLVNREGRSKFCTFHQLLRENFRAHITTNNDSGFIVRLLLEFHTWKVLFPTFDDGMCFGVPGKDIKMKIYALGENDPKIFTSLYQTFRIPAYSVYPC